MTQFKVITFDGQKVSGREYRSWLSEHAPSARVEKRVSAMMGNSHFHITINDPDEAFHFKMRFSQDIAQYRTINEQGVRLMMDRMNRWIVTVAAKRAEAEGKRAAEDAFETLGNAHISSYSK